MIKKPRPKLDEIGDIRKNERVEPEEIPSAGIPTAPRPRIKKVANKRVFSTRITSETDQQISAIMQRDNCTVQEVIRKAVEDLYHTK